ncbi:MAG: Uncharacterized protein CC_3748, partial [uncultured Sphingomonas sp.]
VPHQSDCRRADPAGAPRRGLFAQPQRAHEPRAFAHDGHWREHLSVARRHRHVELRTTGPGGQQRRGDRHRLVRQPEHSGRAGQADRLHPRPGAARRRVASRGLAPGQPNRKLGRCARQRRHRAEAGGHHSHPRPRHPPRHHRRL